jgi:hypothetical protein
VAAAVAHHAAGLVGVIEKTEAIASVPASAAVDRTGHMGRRSPAVGRNRILEFGRYGSKHLKPPAFVKNPLSERRDAHDEALIVKVGKP